MKRIRFILGFVLLYLVIGLITSYLVAIACAWRSDLATLPSPSGKEIAQAEAFLRNNRHGCPPQLTGGDFQDGIGVKWFSVQIINQRYDDRGVIQYWTGENWIDHFDFPEFQTLRFTITGIQAGWPLSTIAGSKWFVSSYGNSEYPSRTFLEFCSPITRPTTTNSSTLLPLGLMWPESAFATALYALATWIPIQVVKGARFLVRRHRGRCTRCGYDLQGVDHLQCPECGRRLTSSKPA